MSKAHSVELYLLISGMTRSEKRYLKRFAGIHRADGLMIEMFDCLSAMKAYDHAAFASRFEEQQHMLPVLKSQLYQFVLKAMRSCHAKSTVRAELFGGLQDLAFLETKGLTNALLSRLRSLKKKAQRYDEQLILLEIGRYEIRHAIRSAKGRLIELVDERAAEMRDNQINAVMEIERLLSYYRLYALNQERGGVSEARFTTAFDELKSNLDRESGESTFYTSYMKNVCLSMLHRMNGEVEIARKQYALALQVWKAHPHMQNEQAARYKALVTNYLNMCHAAGDYSDFDESIDSIRSLPSRTIEEQAANFSDCAHLQLLQSMNSDTGISIRTLEGQIAEGLRKYDKQLSNSRKMVFCYNLLVYHFTRLDFESALDWANAIYDDRNRVQARSDIREFAHAVRLIIFFELGFFELLSSSILAEKRRQKKQSAQFRLLIIDLVEALISAKNLKERKSAFQAALNRIGVDSAVGKKSSKTGELELQLYIENRISRFR